MNIQTEVKFQFLYILPKKNIFRLHTNSSFIFSFQKPLTYTNTRIGQIILNLLSKDRFFITTIEVLKHV